MRPSASVMYIAAGSASIASRDRLLTSPKAWTRAVPLGEILGSALTTFSVELHSLATVSVRRKCCRYTPNLVEQKRTPISGETSAGSGRAYVPLGPRIWHRTREPVGPNSKSKHLPIFCPLEAKPGQHPCRWVGASYRARHQAEVESKGQ